jgi:hypothetical protein
MSWTYVDRQRGGYLGRQGLPLSATQSSTAFNSNPGEPGVERSVERNMQNLWHLLERKALTEKKMPES